MHLLNGTFRTTPPGRGLLGPDISQGFTLGYSRSLPPGGMRSAHRRFCDGWELCEAAMSCQFGLAEKAVVVPEA